MGWNASKYFNVEAGSLSVSKTSSLIGCTIKSGLQVFPEPLAIGKLPWSKRQNHGEARCPDHRHGCAKNATGIGGGGLPRGWGLLAFPQARSPAGVLSLTRAVAERRQVSAFSSASDRPVLTAQAGPWWAQLAG